MSDGFRNIDDIQEETSDRTGRVGTLLLALTRRSAPLRLLALRCFAARPRSAEAG
ncbi:MAG: hypothetical protein U0165_08380 [Polyangiaceae bacterium]